MATRTRRGAASARARKIAARDTELVIYVHGIGEQPQAEQNKLNWDLALFGQDRGDRTRMAHWADILHPASPRRGATRKRATTDQVDVDAALEHAGVDTENVEAQLLAAAFLRDFGVEQRSRSGAQKKIVPLPGILRRPIARAFLESLIGDTAAYFFKKAVRDKIRQRLIAQLPRDGTPITIVAHSQGTIIALDVLATARPGLHVTQFVTLGSPLGIREVQDFLEKPLGVALRIPDAIRDGRWHNFADMLDPVAADKGLSNDFHPTGVIRDQVIVNDATWRIHGFNPHSAVGYLAHPKVRAVVHQAIRFDSMGRFVVARDVAAGLVAEARQPVLIEILEPGYPALGEKREDTRDREVAEMGSTTTSAESKGVALRLRIERAADQLRQVVGPKCVDDARIEPLRRFVAAHLSPSELSEVALRHQDLRVYAVWSSARKRKLLHRSVRVLQADAARSSYGATGEGITWAVLDTGARLDHPHFAKHGNLVELWDCTRRGAPQLLTDPDKSDPDGHGTHVAGIIAGTSADVAGERRLVEGVAPRTKLIVYKVLDDRGEGEDAWIIKALDHIAERNENSAEIAVHGLNLSLGGPYDATVYGCGFTPICQELRRLWRSGMIVCIAAGNEGQLEVRTTDGDTEINNSMSIGDPANLEDCIAIGSVNADKPHLYGISAFSSRGPTSDGRMKPDVVAPGERICSCNSRFRKRGKGAKTTYENAYYEESGTSMAAPHVSGMLAAFLSVRREFRGRPDEVKALLLRTCNDIGRNRYQQGAGIPNLMKMLLEA